MSYAVANGAVGNSPMIDKMNQLTKKQITDRVSEQMERQVFGTVMTEDGIAGAAASCFFDFCREEVKRQLGSLR